MKTMRILCLVLIVAVVLGLAQGASAAGGKDNPTWDKYKLPTKEADLETIPLLFALVMLVGVGVATFKSAHRTHLD